MPLSALTASMSAVFAPGHYVYVLECGDGSFYTGYATDPVRRLRLHAAGRGARYTRARGVRRLLGAWAFPDRSAALSAEHAFKRLDRAAKERTLAAAGAFQFFSPQGVEA